MALQTFSVPSFAACTATDGGVAVYPEQVHFLLPPIASARSNFGASLSLCCFLHVILLVHMVGREGKGQNCNLFNQINVLLEPLYICLDSVLYFF
jgi:hypothetical protein